MIKISNGTETKVVTKGAYENFYKSLNFNIVNDVKPTFKANEEKKVIKEDEVVENKESLKEEKDNFKRK